MPLLKDHLIEENIGLVRMAIKRYRGFGVEDEDLMQIGSVGLIKAARDYDAEKKVQFSTYAVAKIIGEIKTYLRDNGSIKVSRKYKEDKLKIDRATRALSQKLGREPKLSELSAECGLSPEEILTATEATQATLSLDLPPEEGGITPGTPSIEDETLDRVVVGEMLATLSPAERRLMVLRYFLDQTQSVTAAELGMSQVAVSRLEKKILNQLREKYRPK
ncbi:MAG: sigma-70 family RNA polymerase sigma factor [Clostridia bacterium]|nr:sigma-70 family RNA polymerase sigma factor [Clostridia bacterium]